MTQQARPNPPRILIVDDDPEIRDLLELALLAHGYDVETASNGWSMQARLATQTFDVVVIDIGLPDRPIKSLEDVQLPGGAKLIFMSGDPRWMEAPPTGFPFLVKPFRPKNLVALIEAMVNANL
jgi:two-component system, OmpR family, response regulator